MSLPSTISLNNYRAFARRTDLELRPLTLLYGKNSAGKSALLRALPLIGDSVEPNATAALELSGEAAGGNGFLDIKWKGGIDEGAESNLTVGFAWREPSPLSSLEYRLVYDDDRNQILAKSFTTVSRQAPSVTAMLVPLPGDRRSRELTYDVRTEGREEERLKLRFVGLVPEPAAELPITTDINSALLELRGAVQWLKTSRRAPARRIPRTGTAPKTLKPDGGDAADLLRSDPEILGEVSRWFEEHFSRRLEIADAPPSDFRLLFRATNRPEVDIDVANAGEGFVQVLPVLVATAMARRAAAEGSPHILAVEEPESNLHPDAQRRLADYLCSVAAASLPPTLVLETHAYAMLLAIQLQIATGKLPPENVLAYWVEALSDGSSEVQRIEFDSLGRPKGNWPATVFADQRALAYELAREQITREGEP